MSQYGAEGMANNGYTYKEILERVLGVEIGSCYLVQFNYNEPDSSFEIYPCKNLQKECAQALDEMIKEEKLRE